jgi:hypothetical protein
MTAQQKDTIADAGKAAAVAGGIGLIMSAMQNTVQKHTIGAKGVLTRTGGTVAFFGKTFLCEYAHLLFSNKLMDPLFFTAKVNSNNNNNNNDTAIIIIFINTIRQQEKESMNGDKKNKNKKKKKKKGDPIRFRSICLFEMFNIRN